MQTVPFHDSLAITAHYLTGERQHAAKRAALLAEARGARRHTPLAAIGHLLVWLGERLQAAARQPATMKETVQW